MTMFCRQLFLSFLLLVLLGFPQNSYGFTVLIDDNAEPDVEVITNPHDKRDFDGSGCHQPVSTTMTQQLLEPYYLITVPMITQPDTFQEVTEVKIMSVSVPVYRMKQPARLSSAQHSFQLILVKELGHGAAPLVQEVPVDMRYAKDSWFPGFYWTPIVIPTMSSSSECNDIDQQQQQQWQHVGWKFTSLGGGDNTNNDNSGGFTHFYALMVNVEEKEQKQGIRVGGFQAPGWMVARILTK